MRVILENIDQRQSIFQASKVNTIAQLHILTLYREQQQQILLLFFIQ